MLCWQPAIANTLFLTGWRRPPVCHCSAVGNVPLKWYDEEEHIGYDKSGKKIVKVRTLGPKGVPRLASYELG